MSATLHRAHRISACLIGVFIAAHLFSHLLVLDSVAAHLHCMDVLRQVYRNRMVEIILLACVLFQVCSGLYFIKARWGERRGFFAHLQAVSGAYLAFFLLVHVGAVLFGRIALGLDTNFYYAAAGVLVPPYHYFFMPYYFLALLAIFGHLACAAHWLLRAHCSAAVRNVGALAMLGTGVLVASVILAGLAGHLHTIELPPLYRATFTR